MAFTFAVETGMADPDANSYVTVEYADDYIETNIHSSTEWLALSDGTKERLLVRASKILDVRVAWEGERVDQDSGLRWPRSGVYDRDGFLIAEDSIPVALMDAVAEFASYLMGSDWTAPSSNNGFKEIQVGPIEIKFDHEYRQIAIPDTVTMLLEGLGLANSGRRPAFKKIIRH